MGGEASHIWHVVVRADRQILDRCWTCNRERGGVVSKGLVGADVRCVVVTWGKELENDFNITLIRQLHVSTSA